LENNKLDLKRDRINFGASLIVCGKDEDFVLESIVKE